MTATLNPLIVADFSTSLAAGVSVGATTATLQSATDLDGVALAAGTYAFAVDTNSSSKKEYFIATLSGTSLSAIQSVSRQGALSSGFARSHRIGATVALTDHASLRVVSDLLRGSGTLNPSTPLSYDSHPTFSLNTQLIDKKYADDLAIAGAPDASTSTKGISKLSSAPVSATNPISVGDNDPRLPTQSEKDALAGTSGTAVSSSNKLVDNADSVGSGKIVRISNVISRGGNGADGALSVSSGVTTIDLGGAQYVHKQYTSISITGTGQVAFSNPHANGTLVMFSSQTTGTITSSTIPSIDLTGIGSAVGSGTAFALDGITHYGSNGSAGSTGTNGAGATGGATTTAPTAMSYGEMYTSNAARLTKGGFTLFTGNAGGNGAAGGFSGGTAGSGGRGGGAFVMRIAGALTWSSAGGISVAGSPGTAGGTTSSNASNGGKGGGGGGGGGSAGSAIILYGSGTPTGTVTVTGGNGGAGGAGGSTTFWQAGSTSGISVGSGGSGGAGGSNIVAGGDGGAGGNGGAASAAGGTGGVGPAGTAGTTSSGTGGAGGVVGTTVSGGGSNYAAGSGGGGGGGGGGAVGFYVLAQDVFLN